MYYAKWNESDWERQIPCDLICKWNLKNQSKINELVGTENRSPVGGRAKWVKGVKRYKLTVLEFLSTRDVAYSMLTNVYLKVAKQVHLKSSYHKRKAFEATHGHGC